MKTSELNAEQRTKLRGMKRVTDEVTWIVCRLPSGYVQQFYYDLRTYNLYEALLYLENYEKGGKTPAGLAGRILERSLV